MTDPKKQSLEELARETCRRGHCIEMCDCAEIRILCVCSKRERILLALQKVRDEIVGMVVDWDGSYKCHEVKDSYSVSVPDVFDIQSKIAAAIEERFK